MRQGTLALGHSGLKVTDSPPTKTASSSPAKTKHKPVRQAFATQPDPDELSNGGESLDESEDDPDPELGSTSPQQLAKRPLATATESGAASEESSASDESESDSVVVQELKNNATRVQATSSPVRVASTSATLVLGSGSDSDDEPSVSSMRKKQIQKSVSMFDDEASEASDFEDEDVKFVPRRARPSASSQHVVPSSDSDDAPPAPARSARKQALEAMAAKSRSKRKAPVEPSESSDATDSSDALAPSSRKRKPSSPKRRKQSDSPVKRKKKYVQTAGRSADEDSASDIDDFLDDDDGPLGARSDSSSSSSPPVKGKGKGKAVARGRENEARRAAKSKKGGKGKGKARAVESESGSGSEDVDDLELTPPPEPRQKASNKRDYRQKKHAYLGAPSDSESGSESDSGSERDDAPGDDLDEELSDAFIIDEEEEDPDHVVAQYRDQQTRTAQGSKFFVKTYLQLLIHIVICPRVDWRRTDDNFKGASDRVQRDLTGLTSSLIGSSAWRPNFKRAVDERPNFDLVDIDSSMLGAPCVACSMGNKRNSKFTGTTTGKRYDPETFRDLSDSAATDSEDEGDDGKSHNLGEHCAGRAEVYHELKHWPYMAYHELKAAASSIRKVFARLVKPTKQQKQERKDLLVADADRVAAELDANGTIKRIAGTLERMVDEATKGFAVN